jgi:exodeoxyribonuclease VII large subunit
MNDGTIDSIEGSRLDVYTVSELSEAIRQNLESEFPRVSVLGEIANFKEHTSGHWYFTLRDEGAVIGAVVFHRYAESFSFLPENGMLVVATGRLSHFGAQGRTQLLAVDLVPAGRGALELEFRRLLEKLMREGLTAPERKRTLPRYPERILVITSPTGAVIKDIIDTLARRWPVAEIVHVEVEVQGPAAPRSIVRAFGVANGLADVDLVILARGGGSIEDLWAFNSEAVARAVAASVHPVVTGIGHEIDTTVADHVADVRAATPTAAAELATPRREDVERLRAGLVEKLVARCGEIIEDDRHLVEYLLRSAAFPALLNRLEREALGIDDRKARLEASWESQQEDTARRIDLLLSRIESGAGERLRGCSSGLGTYLAALAERNPIVGVRTSAESVRRLTAMLRLRIRSGLSLRRERTRGLLRATAGLDPRRVLERGYAVCTAPPSGAIISRSGQVEAGDRMMVHFCDGRALCAVERKGGATLWPRRRTSSRR